MPRVNVAPNSGRRVVAAATNPGEMMIREGAFADVWPATFPEGQGNDFSGRVAEVGPGEARFSPGDEVMGFTPRAAQADYVRSASDRGRTCRRVRTAR